MHHLFLISPTLIGGSIQRKTGWNVCITTGIEEWGRWEWGDGRFPVTLAVLWTVSSTVLVSVSLLTFPGYWLLVWSVGGDGVGWRGREALEEGTGSCFLPATGASCFWWYFRIQVNQSAISRGGCQWIGASDKRSGRGWRLFVQCDSGK